MTLTKALGGSGGGGGSSLTVKDEGSTLTTAATSIDFVGAGVTATGTTAVTVTIPGGSGALDDLTDVTAPTPADGDLLTYDAGASAWVPAAPSGGATPAEVLISEQVLAAAAATITFSSIAATYRDLRIVLRGRGDTAVNNYCRPRCRMNGDTGTNYDWVRWHVHTSGSEREINTGQTFVDIGLLPASAAPANYAGMVDARIGNYRGTSFYKPLLNHTVSTALGELYSMMGGGWWKSTSAITSLTLSLDNGSYVAGTVASLYGIL